MISIVRWRLGLTVVLSLIDIWIIIVRWRLRLNVLSRFCITDMWIISIAGGIVRGRLRLGIVVCRVLDLNRIWSLRLSPLVLGELCVINLKKIDISPSEAQDLAQSGACQC